MTAKRLVILRKPDMMAKFGFSPEARADSGRTVYYTQLDNLERDQLIPPRIKLTKRAVGWYEHEVDAVLVARGVGKSDEEIRALVKRLVAARARAFDQYEAA